MSFLPKDVLDGLDAARTARPSADPRLRAAVGGRSFPVLRLWKSGFSVSRADAPHLRGYIDVHDGPVHLFQCLIVAAEEDGLEMKFEFKRATAIMTGPALDFERPETAPVGLIEASRGL